jgi:uncharacterized protein YoxC
MTNRDKLEPNSKEYTNALLEDIESKFQVVLEATAPIPKMQEDITSLKDTVGKMRPQLDAVTKTVGEMKPQLDILTQTVGEMKPQLDAVFEEVGKLRKDVEIIKEAMKLLGRRDARLDKIDQRLVAVEQRV